jgi:hypothetical protein
MAAGLAIPSVTHSPSSIGLQIGLSEASNVVVFYTMLAGRVSLRWHYECLRQIIVI